MDDIDKSLKSYLERSLKQPQPQACPGDDILADYIAGGLPAMQAGEVEKHISGCKDCLEKTSLAMKADTAYKARKPGPASLTALDKAKEIAAGPKHKARPKGYAWLLASVAAFALSFLFKRYFLQFLAATILLGVKWIVESENVRTLILVLDSWRRHEHGHDDEIAQRLRERGKMNINDK